MIRKFMRKNMTNGSFLGICAATGIISWIMSIMALKITMRSLE